MQIFKTLETYAKKCNEQSPSQQKEPMLPTPSPKYPFQMECADYFAVQGHSYLTYVDCYSGWINIFHFKPHQSTSKNLISECQSPFQSYGSPEEFSSRWWPPIHIN